MNNITIYDLLLSLSYAENIDLKDDVVSILEESNLLDETEKDALELFIKKCIELAGIPKPETLASFDSMYQTANKIIATSIEDFTKMFINNRKKQKLSITLTNAAMDLTKSNSDINKVIETLNANIDLYGNSTIEEDNISSLDDAFLEEITKTKVIQKGVPVGDSNVDNYFPGILPGSITVVAGFAGSMKTTLAANIAYNCLKHGKNVLYISLEVNKKDLFFNLLARHSYHDFSDRYTKEMVRNLANENVEEFMKLGKSFNSLSGRMKIVDESDIKDYTMSSFKLLFNDVHKELTELTGHGFDILVIDHMQLLKFDESHKRLDPYQIVNNFTSHFRRYAVKNNIGLILVSQTSRAGVENARKHHGNYELIGLAEANELERAATGVITLFKDGNSFLIQLIKSRGTETMEDCTETDIDGDYYIIGNDNINNSEQVAPPLSMNNNIETKEETIKFSDNSILPENLESILEGSNV